MLGDQTNDDLLSDLATHIIKLSKIYESTSQYVTCKLLIDFLTILFEDFPSVVAHLSNSSILFTFMIKISHPSFLNISKIHLLKCIFMKSSIAPIHDFVI